MGNFAGGIVGAIGGKHEGKAKNLDARLNTRLSAINAESTNKVRLAENAAGAAKNNLDRWIQSVSNNRALDSGGEALEATIVNARRGADQAMQQSFAASVQSAEQAGGQAAAAAAAGIDGGVVDMVNSSVALRDSIAKQHASNMLDVATYDVARRAGSIMSQMVGGLDQSLILDTFNHNIAYAQETAEFGTFANMVRGAMQGFGAGGALNTQDGGTRTETDTFGNEKQTFNFESGRSLSIGESDPDYDWTVNQDDARGDKEYWQGWGRNDNGGTETFGNVSDYWSN